MNRSPGKIDASKSTNKGCTTLVVSLGRKEGNPFTGKDIAVDSFIFELYNLAEIKIC